MTTTKISGLTASNVRAIRETIPNVDTTATTATFGTDALSARMLVEATMDRLPTRGHPRASLHAVRRKLAKLAPEGWTPGLEGMRVIRQGAAHRIDSDGRTVDAHTGEGLEL